MLFLLLQLFLLTQGALSPNRLVLILDGFWQFAFLTNVSDPTTFNPSGVNFNDIMSVPGAYDAMPRYSSLRGTGVYRLTVPQTPNTYARLHFEACSMYCAIWVDGKQVGTHSNGYSPFWQGGIPPSASGTREIIVVADNRFDVQRTPLQYENYDFYQYGGLIRTVALHVLPALSITNVDVITQDIGKGVIDARLRVHFSASSNPPTSVMAAYSFDGQPLSSPQSLALTAMSTPNDYTASFISLIVPNPTLWSPQQPNLHSLTVQITSTDGVTKDSVAETFGLRTVTSCPGANGTSVLCINGAAVKLKGYCRHDFHIMFGSHVPQAQMIYDLQLLKDMGGNYLRLVHYPHDPHFLALADRLGIMVWQENLGWGNSEAQITDPTFVNAQLQGQQEMVYNTFNHPSIILWAFLNEGASNSAASCSTYQKLAQGYRDLKVQGLVTWASNQEQNDVCYSVANPDVISWNSYPGWYASSSEYDLNKLLGEVQPTLVSEQQYVNSHYPTKPFLKSEIGAGGIYGFSDAFFGPGGFWSVEYQGALLDLVAEECMENSGISGVSLWQFFDIRTYNGPAALNRPRSYNNKGTFDEYRRPKAPAYSAVKSHWT